MDFKTSNYNIPNSDGQEQISSFSDSSWITKDAYDDVLGKVMGCGHAITDVTTLALGDQCVGRALFLEHSFYNHSCAPNAFISCHIGDERQEQYENGNGGDTLMQKSTIITKDDSENEGGMHRDEQNKCALFACVQCIDTIEKDKPVVLSYIPTSGIDRKERQDTLLNGYHFTCQCVACSGVETNPLATKWEKTLKLPEGNNVNITRQMQYSCNESLINIQQLDEKLSSDGDENNNERDELIAGCIMMIRMSMNGIKNQDISPHHEVSIEAHRLLAAALSLSGNTAEALREHQHFFDAIAPVSPLIDPVVIAAQRVEFARDLGRNGDTKEQKQQLEKAKELSEICLGSSHSFVRQIKERITDLEVECKAKKRRLNNK